ncbi:protein dmr6-like oxygenase 1, partial [Quercus suber]
MPRLWSRDGKTSLQVFELIALSLGLPTDRFYNFFKDHNSNFRLNHYPPCPTPKIGSEVERWRVGLGQTHPDAYIVNVGDIIQVWSNDKYKSVEHRAMVNPERERFSIPFFFNPTHYTMIKPIEEMTNEQNPAKYKAYNWGKFKGLAKDV